MAEELSPESKLYVKEEIDKIRKEFKEDLKEAQSKATKTFTTVALIVGLLTCVGVYGIAARAIQKGLDETTIKELEDEAKKLVADANNSYNNIVEYENDANDILSKLSKNFDQKASVDGYQTIGGIKFIWGTRTSKLDIGEIFEFGEGGFPSKCFTIITELPGDIIALNTKNFKFDRMNDYDGVKYFSFVAIGN